MWASWRGRWAWKAPRKTPRSSPAAAQWSGGREEAPQGGRPTLTVPGARQTGPRVRCHRPGQQQWAPAARAPATHATQRTQPPSGAAPQAALVPLLRHDGLLLSTAAQRQTQGGRAAQRAPRAGRGRRPPPPWPQPAVQVGVQEVQWRALYMCVARNARTARMTVRAALSCPSSSTPPPPDSRSASTARKRRTRTVPAAGAAGGALLHATQGWRGVRSRAAAG